MEIRKMEGLFFENMVKKAFVFLAFVLLAKDAFPCSSFVLKNGAHILLGKNFDWTFPEGHLVKNLRNTSKVAYFTHDGIPATWTSKYGSVTFNQNGKEMPYGGMNEKGLVVEMLWLEDTRYNTLDNKSYLNELEWIQYQLDNFQSIEEVTANIEKLKIYPIKGKIHYILADRGGQSVVIEYISGRAFIFPKDPNTCQAITNKTVSHSEKYINNLDGIPKRNTSETFRYHQLEKQIAKLNSPDQYSEKAAFQMLKSVSIPKGDFKTMWSIVYDVQNLGISFFTVDNSKVKKIDLQRLDFEGVLETIDLNQNETLILNGNLKPFSAEENLKTMSASLIHLGFDEPLTADLASHQMAQIPQQSSEFSRNYFHFDITIPLTEEGKRLIVALMDNEENFNKRQVVPGGFYRVGTIVTDFNIHVYGLRAGLYSLIALIDDNRNNELDFDNEGQALENYATFNAFVPKRMADLNFSTTSAFFDRSNATLRLEWR